MCIEFYDGFDLQVIPASGRNGSPSNQTSRISDTVIMLISQVYSVRYLENSRINVNLTTVCLYTYYVVCRIVLFSSAGACHGECAVCILIRGRNIYNTAPYICISTPYSIQHNKSNIPFYTTQLQEDKVTAEWKS